MTYPDRFSGTVVAKAPRLIGGLVLGAGVLLLVGAVVANLLQANTWERRSANTTGIVVDVTTSHSAKHRTTYCPVVEFIADGKVKTFTATQCDRPAPQIGDRLGVRYDPDHPSDAILDSWMTRALLVLLLGILGVLGTGAGVYLLTRARRGT